MKKTKGLTKINLSNIGKCSQNWNDMIPCKNGRICQACNKNIIDFRSKSDKEIAEIHAFSLEPVCGLYREDQLKIEKTKQLKIGNKFRGIWLGVLTLFFSNDISGQEVKQTHPIEKVDEKSNKKRIHKITKSENRNSKTVIYGKIQEESGEAVIGAIVVIRNTKFAVSSDFEGKYSMDITELLGSNDEIVIEYIYLGFENIHVKFRKNDDRNIDVIFDKPLMPQVHVISFGVQLIEDSIPRKVESKKTISKKLEELIDKIKGKNKR